jgi:hypothetical protein
LKEHRSKAGVMRPDGDMTPEQPEHPRKEEWFEGKVRELGDAIGARVI